MQRFYHPVSKRLHPDMRIKYNNRYFDIEAIINDDEMNKTLTIHAKENFNERLFQVSGMEELLAQLRHMGEKGDKIKEQAEMEGAKIMQQAIKEGTLLVLIPNTLETML
ncbi:head-tail adaptor protein [Paenibacillus larvae]|nr:head-tail adaptor protein [Paenibacillus larvae]MDT2261689.1 head-tail adaptor protein [Paenibacillus larvae]